MRPDEPAKDDVAYSVEAYGGLLRTAKAAGVRFARYGEPPPPGRWVLLRHDVDLSVELAVAFARVNAAEGVRGTFFVLLGSQIYNALSHRSRRAVATLQALGQDVALHVPVPEPMPRDAAGLEAALAREFALASAAFPFLRRAFAWHNPTPEVLERSLAHPTMAGWTNAYAAGLRRDVPYLSDSNRRHPVPVFREALGPSGPPALQLLLHPELWVAGGADVHETFANVLVEVLREREAELLENRAYTAAFPQGMPAEVLAAFRESWLREARARLSVPPH